MESNKRILVFAVWFVPGYKAGGPIRSVFNLVKALSPFCDIDVVTSNTDFNETLPYPNIASDIWIEKDNFRVIYLSKKNERPFIKNLLQSSNYQSVYFNSMYSLSFALYPLWLLKNKPNAPKIVLAPRGMLGQGS
jgi:hypothetical protein